MPVSPVLADTTEQDTLLLRRAVYLIREELKSTEPDNQPLLDRLLDVFELALDYQPVDPRQGRFAFAQSPCPQPPESHAA